MQTNLRLTNTSQTLDVLYKVQTTSPANYRVRPSHGRIVAGENVEIQVVMIAGPVKADKFLIKYVTLTHSTAPPGGDFMKQFQQAEATSQERRLRVSVVGLDESFTASPHTITPQRTDSISSEKGIAAEATSISAVGSTPSVNSGIGNSGAPSTNNTVVSGDLEVLNQELKEAKAKIQLLVSKNQELSKALEDSKNLRRRIEKDEIEHPSTKLERGISQAELDSLISSQAGFPPVLVILIALFTFLLGLLF